jgi:hypothetical protein
MHLIIMHDGPLFCVLCQEPLLPFPVFWIDRHKDGIHEACEEQRLVDQELEDALRNEAIPQKATFGDLKRRSLGYIGDDGWEEE